MKNKFSVIIPTFNEERFVSRCIASVRAAGHDAEVIVVDGGSLDQTLKIARREKVLVYTSKKGRGYQLNEGAQHASGDVLLFLHADTQLPLDAFSILTSSFENLRVQIGKFAVVYDRKHMLLDLCSKMSRIDSFWTSFGDHCIVMRKSFFKALRGFPEWPLFEDVRLFQNARRLTTIHPFPSQVTTSADKFFDNGIFRQSFRNFWLIVQYSCGVSPETLYRKYY